MVASRRKNAGPAPSRRQRRMVERETLRTLAAAASVSSFGKSENTGTPPASANPSRRLLLVYSRSPEGWRTSGPAGSDAVFPKGPQGQDPTLSHSLRFGLVALVGRTTETAVKSYGEVNGEPGFREGLQPTLSC